jgi:hypothetical protein
VQRERLSIPTADEYLRKRDERRAGEAGANPETSKPTDSAAFVAVRLQPIVCSMGTIKSENE